MWVPDGSMKKYPEYNIHIERMEILSIILKIRRGIKWTRTEKNVSIKYE